MFFLQAGGLASAVIQASGMLVFKVKNTLCFKSYLTKDDLVRYDSATRILLKQTTKNMRREM